MGKKNVHLWFLYEKNVKIVVTRKSDMFTSSKLRDADAFVQQVLGE